MKKIRLYLDTSVISHLYAPDKIDWMEQTQLMWDDLKAGKYDVVVSDVVFREINGCKTIKRNILENYLKEIDYTRISINDTVTEIANEIIKKGFLKERNRLDCLHIGCAISSRCQYLVSWNINDLVKIETIEGVREITNLLHFPSINIVTPYVISTKEEK